MRIDNNTSNKFLLNHIFIVVVMALIVMGRFVQLGIFKSTNGIDLTELSMSSIVGSSINDIPRGTIYDQNGVPLAIDATSYSLFAIVDNEGLSTVSRPIETANMLSEHLNMSAQEIYDILQTEDVVQVEFGPAGKNISRELKESIESEGFSGLGFYENQQRKYINNYFASHLIGYLSEDEQYLYNGEAVRTRVGKSGVEAAFNDQLSGIDDFYLMQTHEKLLRGRDVYLTLNSQLQNHLEQLLTTAYEKYEPELISGYLVELGTGKLLSAGQRPSYNLNTLEGIDQDWEGQFVSEAYEPGSTLKILTQSIAYDRNIYQPNELVMTGSIEIEDTVVKDYNLYGWGEIPFDEALARSSNVSMVELVRRMGLESWEQTLEELGFGQSTHSDLPGENTGFIDFDNPVSVYMSGFGQAISATPIQLMQAYSMIGNQGDIIKIQYAYGSDTSDYETQKIKTMIRPESAQHILDILMDAVEQPYGTAQDFKMPNVRIAAKTGTAQIANPTGAGYLTGPNDYYFSVVSFFPAEQPEYMLYLTLKRPENNQGRMGSQILAEVFKPFVDYVLLNN